MILVVLDYVGVAQVPVYQVLTSLEGTVYMDGWVGHPFNVFILMTADDLLPYIACIFMVKGRQYSVYTYT